MPKTKIEWTDYSLNPIKGRCKKGCWYCYYSGEHGILNRFKIDPRLSLDMHVFWTLPKKPSKVFLCSTHELFGSWIPKDWRDKIFKRMEDFPQHTFQVLTKMPENIDRPMPDNVWLGVSITTQGEIGRYRLLKKAIAPVKFVSFEPLLSYIELPIDFYIDWVIIGKLTGYAKWRNPKKYWVYIVTERLKKMFIPIFLKNNLKEIWGDKLIQEFPK